MRYLLSDCVIWANRKVGKRAKKNDSLHHGAMECAHHISMAARLSQVLLPPFAWLVGRSAQSEPRKLLGVWRAGWFRAGFEEVQDFVEANAVEL